MQFDIYQKLHVLANENSKNINIDEHILVN